MTEISRTHPTDVIYSEPSVEELERRARQYARVDEMLAAERQADLDDLFHIDPTFAIENPEEAAKLKAQFLEEKKGLNLGECFALSLRDPYFGKVHIVKLASTDHSEPDASQRMFHEVNDYMRWLKTEGPLVGLQSDPHNGYHISETMGDDEVREALSQDEDPGNHADRQRSGRWMEYEFFDDEDGDPAHQLAVIRRLRPFVDVEAEIRGEMCSVKLFKETVFTIKAVQLRELLLRNDFFNNPIAERRMGKMTEDEIFFKVLSNVSDMIEGRDGRHVESNGKTEVMDDNGDRVVYREDTFAREHDVYPEAVKDHPNPISHAAMKIIEAWLYTPSGDDPAVQRHRNYTAIYSAVVPHSADQRMMEAYDS